MTTSPIETPDTRPLYQSIAAVILAFIPILSIGGVILGFTALKKANKAKDKLTQVLSIIALIIGTLFSIHTILVLYIYFFRVTPH